MKKIGLLLIILSMAFAARSQIVQSSCTAHDSIISKYQEDADRLALERIYRNSMHYADSVIIPKPLSDTVLRALIAVYNADSLPARDTVINILQIHTFPMLPMRMVSVNADTSLFWMKAFAADSFPTGKAGIDSILTHYPFDTTIYYQYPWDTIGIVMFRNDSINYNIFPIMAYFDSIQGVKSVSCDWYAGEGDDIIDSVTHNYVELIYKHGWGDCWAGCSYARYWKFKVYYDCKVEYCGSWGNLLNTVPNYSIKKPNVYPNPFSDKLFIDNHKNFSTYSIHDISGKLMIMGNITGNTIETHSTLLPGIYFLILNEGGYNYCRKIIKAR